MKVFPFTIPKTENVTLYIQEYKGKGFYDKLHQHQELQISLIVQGEGTYVIGDCVGEFGAGDIFVLGESLPHIFKPDLFAGEEAHMISLFFAKDSYGTSFFNYPEFRHIQSFLEDTALGIEIQSNKPALFEVLSRIDNESAFEQFKSFITIMDLVACAKRRKLSSLINLKKYNGSEGKRMRAIFQHTMNNFQKEITLSEVADIANMTPNAFCRYFKQRTNKTFIHFLIDIRIGNACKLLAKNNEMSITEISYKSGFNNLANFNRKFKSLKGVTPSEYRKRH